MGLITLFTNDESIFLPHAPVYQGEQELRSHGMLTAATVKGRNTPTGEKKLNFSPRC